MQEEIWITSSLDGSLQPSLFFRAEGKRPLLVGLHTWSHDRYNQIKNMLPYAQKYGFHLLLPEFRGNNLKTNPHCTEACCSELALRDVRDAIEYVLEREDVDTENIFLLGLSGGGLMALMMAGYCPERFKAIGAYVPITDLHTWTQENAKYAPHVLACCSGSAEEMRKRSPMSYIDSIAKANLKIFHGKFDRVVPVAQSLRFFQRMMEQYPKASVYLDIFDGGHEIDMEQAMYWLLSQYQKVRKTVVTG